MPNSHEHVSANQAQYYGDLFDRHGPSVDAVASGKQAYKDLRYERLCNLIPEGTRSLHDVGFGLGHLNEYLRARPNMSDIAYSGSEVTPQFVDHCTERYPEGCFFLRDLTEVVPDEKYDCVVLSGTFYHRRNTSEEDFLTFAETLLTNSFAMCRRGMVFNLISPFVDYRIGDLFYADLPRILKLVQRLSRFFVLDHATPLYEYTLAIYREEHVSSMHPNDVFDKYFDARRTNDTS